jgi:hypothetical protein
MRDAPFAIPDDPVADGGRKISLIRGIQAPRGDAPAEAGKSFTVAHLLTMLPTMQAN